MPHTRLAGHWRGATSGAAGEHHEQAIVLTAVMPGAPAKIESKYPRQCLAKEMREQKGEKNQAGDMDREHPVFIEIFLGMVGAINRRHVMRVVEDQRQGVETYRPCGDTGVSSEIAE